MLTAELTRIERLMLDDPDYFSQAIPFCLVMGISDKVEKRFKPLNLVLPDWANGTSVSAFAHNFPHSLASSGGGGGSSGGGGGSRGC